MSDTSVASECRLPREHFIEHRAKCPDVAALVAALAARLLGDSLCGGTGDESPSCVSAGLVSVGDSVTLADAISSITAFASPKSSTFTVPSGRHLMFAGFRSRWTMPCEWAAASASAICRAIGMASSNDRRPSAIRSASVGPSTSSRTNA